MKKIGYAVLGLGVGESHAKFARKHKWCELVAVCDIVREKVDRVTAMYPEAIGYTDFDEMLKNDKIDIVSICLPTAMHADYAIKAMEAGKHILIEKPMDVTPEAVMRIEEARKRTGVKVGGIFQNRTNAIMPVLKKAIDDGALGRVFLGTFAVKWYREQSYYEGEHSWHGTWSMDGGGSLINQAIHTLDIMQWLMGLPISVSTQMGVYNHDIESEDTTASVFAFENGATATFVSTTCAHPGLSTDIQLYGTNGSVEIDYDALRLWKIKGQDELDEEDMLDIYGGGNDSAIRAGAAARCGHEVQVHDMIDAVLEDREPQIVPLEAIKAVKIVNAAYESARRGGELVKISW